MTEIYCTATMHYARGALEVEPVEVSIRNGRTVDHLAWETQGFELLAHTPSVSEWDNAPHIETDHYPEMEDLARELSGCDHALIAGHIHRNPSAAARHLDFAPIQYVHSDFTHTYGDLVRQRYLNSEPATEQALTRAGLTPDAVSEARRIMILQFWRNIGPQAADLPLAFCDAQTVPDEDLISFHVPEYGGEAIPFDTFGVRNPEHREHAWYTFPAMTEQEVVAFRTYDSELADQGGSFWTPHSAFADPIVSEPQPRASIELRATCLFF